MTGRPRSGVIGRLPAPLIAELVEPAFLARDAAVSLEAGDHGFPGGAAQRERQCGLRQGFGDALRQRSWIVEVGKQAVETITDHFLHRLRIGADEDLRESRPEPVIRAFGQLPARPKTSVVIPLYRVYDFLRVQVAAFAGDRWFTENAELIYVLDSSEHEVEVAHLLVGLHLAYGLPMQLVAMRRNGGFSAACNAGVAQARGDIPALVNSDVIPTGNGWLEGLIARLDRCARVGAVGPKLLYDDNSLQHAGLFFKRDSKGAWLNHHYFKGMPGGYAPANIARSVLGAADACIVMARESFGMTEVGSALFTPYGATSMVGSGTCGIASPFREATIRDEDGTEVPPGEIGELWIRGPGILQGYWNKPEANAESFREGGWFRTGDLFRRDERGFHYIVGRIKDMIRRSGENIAAREVEAVMLGWQDILEAAAIPVPGYRPGAGGKGLHCAEAGRCQRCLLCRRVLRALQCASRAVQGAAFPRIPREPAENPVREGRQARHRRRAWLLCR